MMDARARPRTPACAPPRGMQSQPSFQLLLLGRLVSQKQPRRGSSAPSPTRLLSSLSLSFPAPALQLCTASTGDRRQAAKKGAWQVACSTTQCQRSLLVGDLYQRGVVKTPASRQCMFSGGTSGCCL